MHTPALLQKHHRGFTLIELLVVIGIIGLMSVGLLGSYSRSRDTQQLLSSAEIFSDMAKRAHIYSREVKDGKTWGIASNTLQSYELISMQTSPPHTTEEFKQLPKYVSFTAPFEIWFEKGSGRLSTMTSVTLKNVQNKEIVVEMSPAGVVDVVPK